MFRNLEAMPNSQRFADYYILIYCFFFNLSFITNLFSITLNYMSTKTAEMQ